jgi:hypothetical protein
MATAPPDGNRVGAIIQSMFARIKSCGFAPSAKAATPNQLLSVMRGGPSVNSDMQIEGIGTPPGRASTRSRAGAFPPISLRTALRPTPPDRPENVAQALR